MKPRLGKGFNAVLADTALEHGFSHDQGVLEIPLDQIKPNPDQPRRDFDQAALEDLSESIREKGVIQPIIVVQDGVGSYRIVAGERRFRASMLAGKNSIPALVREYSQEENYEVALIENIQREDLNPVEEAMAYRSLMDSFSLNQEQVAKKIGKNRSTVANSLRLLKLPDEVLQGLASSRISAGHARAILSAPDEFQLPLYHEIVGNGYSVRESEALAKTGALRTTETTSQDPAPDKGEGVVKPQPSNKPDRPVMVELAEIEEKLRFALGTKVALKGDSASGKIEIAYFSMDDLDRLTSLLLGPGS